MALTRPTTTRLDDTNEIVSTGLVDDVKYPSPTPPPPPPASGGNSLNLSDDNTEYLSLASDMVLSGEFSMQVTCQDLIQNGTGIPLFAGTTTANRVLIDSGLGKVNLNIGGSALVSKSVPGLDVIAKNTYKLYRDSANDIYFQVDAETPIFIVNNANNFTLRYIGKASSAFKITGRIHDFKINDDEFLLTEGTGNTLTSGNGLSVFTINSTAGLTHINEVVWSVAPPESSAIQVINSGVSGDNSLDMKNRFEADVTPHAPDMVFILAGTNDCLVPGKILTPDEYKTNVLWMVNRSIEIGAIPVIWNIPPCIDSYCKINHDYTGIYGPEGGYNLNTDILELFRVKIAEILIAVPSCLHLDIKALITDFSEAQTSLLKNEANTFSGNIDGVHLVGPGTNTINNGRLITATAMVPICSGKTKIVIIGDSNMAQGGASAVPVYLSQLLNS